MVMDLCYQNMGVPQKHGCVAGVRTNMNKMIKCPDVNQ